VSHGNEQDSTLYPNKSSPTAAIHSLFTVLALYAGKTKYQMGKVDIKGAFVQTPMMKLSKNVVKYVMEVFPEYQKYVTAEGVLYTRMLKAMYGCVQASRLWFEYLTKVLRAVGYKSASMDECVMCKRDGAWIHVIIIYVDDLLIFATHKEMEILKRLLVQQFKWITMEVKEQVSYLGLQINRWDNQFELEMEFFVKKLLEPYQTLPIRSTPGTRTVYQVDAGSKQLNEAERKIFHTETAKLLFLAMRVRPDILTVVSFLCTRVTRATVEDRKKLARTLGYLKGTMTQSLVICYPTSQQFTATCLR
jgi:hypothetical protein